MYKGGKMRNNPRTYEKYKHFKGKLYQIIAIAEDSETRDEQVVYQMLYSPFQIYVRPLKMFMSKVDSGKYPNSTQKFRFEQVKELEKTKELEQMEIRNGKFEYPEFEENIMSQEESDMKENLDYDVDEVVEPLLLDFFDADSYEAKLGVLRKLYPIITNDMINAISMTLDIEINEGTLEKRYQEVMKCLVTLEKYECNRLRM